MNCRQLPARQSQEASQATQAFVCRCESLPQMGLFRELSHGPAFFTITVLARPRTSSPLSSSWAAFDVIIKFNLSDIHQYYWRRHCANVRSGPSL